MNISKFLYNLYHTLTHSSRKIFSLSALLILLGAYSYVSFEEYICIDNPIRLIYYSLEIWTYIFHILFIIFFLFSIFVLIKNMFSKEFGVKFKIITFGFFVLSIGAVLLSLFMEIWTAVGASRSGDLDCLNNIDSSIFEFDK